MPFKIRCEVNLKITALLYSSVSVITLVAPLASMEKKISFIYST